MYLIVGGRVKGIVDKLQKVNDLMILMRIKESRSGTRVAEYFRSSSLVAKVFLTQPILIRLKLS